MPEELLKYSQSVNLRKDGSNPPSQQIADGYFHVNSPLSQNHDKDWNTGKHKKSQTFLPGL